MNYRLDPTKVSGEIETQIIDCGNFGKPRDQLLIGNDFVQGEVYLCLE